jgi:hypothetical protein
MNLTSLRMLTPVSVVGATVAIHTVVASSASCQARLDVRDQQGRRERLRREPQQSPVRKEGRVVEIERVLDRLRDGWLGP